MNTYNRVIPRDFFNEAKLLKCMGKLSLDILNGNTPEGIKIYLETQNDERFLIEQNEYDGSIYVANCYACVNDETVLFKTLLNSKDSYPMYCEYGNTDYQVFYDDGSYSDEFINMFNN